MAGAAGGAAPGRSYSHCPLYKPRRPGGWMRYYELAEIVRVGAPIYLKFGLRSAPNIYPTGTHLEQVAIQTGRARGGQRSRCGPASWQRFVRRSWRDIEGSEQHV